MICINDKSTCKQMDNYQSNERTWGKEGQLKIFLIIKVKNSKHRYEDTLFG